MKEYKGIIPAIITPLQKDGDVNERALRKLLDYLTGKGVHGFYIGGSNGEGLVLSVSTRKKLLEIVKDHIGDSKILIAHVGALNTNDSVTLARHAQETGVDAISSIPPFYYPLDFKAIYEYYKTISNAVLIPVFIYNIPITTGVLINCGKVMELINIDNIIGIKYSHDDVVEMRKIKALKNGDFKVFFGQDGMLAAGLVMGADGGIGGSYNIMAGKYTEIYAAVCNNDWKTAARIQYEIIRYREIYFKYGTISVLKFILTYLLDEDMGGVTPPLMNLTCEEKDSLISEFNEKSFFDFIK